MRLLHRLRNQRGSILLFTTVLVVPLMIIVGGLAIDLAYYGTVDGEIQRSMDAAALAGAGKLGFDAGAFAGARQAAQNYATQNLYRAESHAKQITTSTFTQNAGNADTGNVVLGTWNGTTRVFAPSLNGTIVNAVKCQYNSTIPTSFLRLIGLNSLSTAAGAIAVSSPPATLCPGCCLFPLGVTQCPFQTGGPTGSQGCGQPVATVTPSTTNTAAWLGANKPDIQQAVNNAASGATCNTTLKTGDPAATNNGNLQTVWDSLADCNGNSCKTAPGTSGIFINKYNSAATYTVRNSSEQITYQGHGWEVFVAVINTPCPAAGPLPGTYQVLTFSRLVITQVIDHGRCAVQNHWSGNLWDAQCPTPNGTCTTCSGGGNAIFGYFSCAPIDALPAPIPTPRAALATKIKLVR